VQGGNRYVRVNIASTAFRVSWVLLLVLTIPFAAHAAGDGEIRNYIISINRLYENLEYELALNRIQLARQVPRGTDEEVTLSLYEGIILYEMGKQGPGTTSLKSALFLRPDAKLPVQVAPKIEQFFESVRKQVKSEVAALLTPREARNPSSKAEQKRGIAAAATGHDGDRPPSNPPRLEGSPTPSERRQVDAVPKEQPTPFVEKRENKGVLQSSKKEGTLRSPPTIPAAPKQENRVGLGQLNTSGCQAAVSTECERHMKRLLQLQDMFLRADSSFRLGPIEELAGLAKQLRAASTHKTLQDASQALDSWQQRNLPTLK
jgi:hypothetical protein